MIYFKEHKNIDKQKWDACVKQSSDSVLFVYSWYLDIVYPGWCALVLDDYKAVFPLPVKSKLRIAYLHQPFFTRYFGLFTKENMSNSLVNDFLNAIPTEVKYIEYCLHEQNRVENDAGFKISEKKFQVLELATHYEQIQKNFNENTKRNIKKAVKAGFNIVEDIKPEEIVELFRKTKGKELETFTRKNYDTLLKLMRQCVLRGQGKAIGVFDEKHNLHAAGFFMGSNERFVFLKSGVSPEGRKNGAMHFMFDYFIRQQAGNNSILDFGGSSVESVAKFYKGFGAKEIVYLQIKKNNLPFPLKLLKP